MVNRLEQKNKKAAKKHYLKGVALGKFGYCTAWAVNSDGVGQEWVEEVKVQLGIRNLPESFIGRRIVHISDLHCSRTVSEAYLRRCVERVNRLAADIVVLTGDYVTYDIYGRFREKVVDIIGGIDSRYGVYACLGNHDYGVGNGSRRKELLCRLIGGMESKGVSVLRNESKVVKADGQSIRLVGVGDLLEDDFKPARAFAKAKENEAVIALAHNPESAAYMRWFPADVIMSGHTHGARFCVETSPELTIKSREFHSGMYDVGGKKLYVNRGLGRVGKVLFNARPEITVYTLGAV